jgi:hypothetical protein
VRQTLWLLALVACTPEGREAANQQPHHWVVPPGPVAWPLGEVTGRIGRSQAPQPVVSDGIEGPQTTALDKPTAWPVPGTAHAVVYGLDRGKPALELVDIDRGVVLWRTGDAAPVVGVTDKAIVVADARGTRGFSLDGKPRWKHEATFIAMTDDRVIEAGAPDPKDGRGAAVISEADSGDEVARVKLPAGVTGDSVIASCGDAGRELFAAGQDGKLVHVVEGKGGPTTAWSAAVGTVFAIDACSGDSVLVTASTDAGTTLYALARDSGTIAGRIDGVRGYWPARDGTDRLEVSTAAGVMLHARTLAGDGVPVALPVLGELLAKRGDRRLVRATRRTAALLDRNGVRAYLPLAERGAVLGDDTVLAADWLAPATQTVRRLRIPPHYRRALRILPDREPVSVPAELRDLPPVGELPAGIAKPGAPMQSIGAIALAGTSVLVGYDAGLARFDLHARQWSWLRDDGCGGPVIGVAAARDVAVCATAHEVRATSLDGAPRWTWHGDADEVAAAGDVVLVTAGDHLHVLDARDGHVLGELVSDDGGKPRATAIDVAGMTMIISAERGRVVGRLARVELLPAWSLEVAGVVESVEPSADGAVIALEDGDAYRVDARTGAAIALPGIGLVWRAPGDVVTGEAAGGPIPPDKMPAPPRPKLPLPKPPPPPKDPNLVPPPIATPWPPPPPMADSWQYTLYELTGGLRARNDYALPPPVVPSSARGPGDSPLVVVYGPGLHDAIVIDPHRGNPLRRVTLPDEAGPGLVFGTVVDGKAIAGAVLAKPLRVVLF